MGVLVSYSLAGAKIEELLLDATVQELHSSRGEVTDFPVETGADISEHKRVLPDRVRIEGVISNTPLPSQTNSPSTFKEDIEAGVYAQRAETAYDTLRNIHETGTAVTIYTALRTYERMQLESLEIPRNVETGDALRFAADFKQITTVDSQTAELSTSISRNATKSPKANKGMQPKKPVEEAQEESANSLLRTLKEKIIGGSSPASMYPGVSP
jgi:hypothetical protein